MGTSLARSFILAWHFLTAISLNRHHHDPTPDELAQSMAWFPLVGLGIGAVLALSTYLLSSIFVRGVSDMLLLVVLVLLTRGLHQDGLADTLDGWAGGRTPERRLEIMRDPRIGAIGAMGLMLGLGLRYAGLMALPEPGRLALLVCMPAVGRWAMVLGSLAVPYARAEGGLAQPFLQHLATHHVLIATAWVAIGLLFSMTPLAAMLSLVIVLLMTRALTVLSRRLCEGITGDTLGMTNEVAEIVFLLMAPVFLRLA